MKTYLGVFILGALSLPVLSQESERTAYHHFRGQQLLAFNSNQFTQAKPLNAGTRNIHQPVVQNPGDSFFIVHSLANQSAALYNEEGEQVQRIDLGAGENHLDLSMFAPGLYYLNDLTQGKLISTLVNTK